MRNGNLRPTRRSSLLPALGVALLAAGCTALEPRRRDPLPTKILKGAAWVPASAAVAAGAVASWLVEGTARNAGDRFATERDLGSHADSREIFGIR